MRKLLLLLSLIMIVGCCGTKQSTVSETTTVKDSTVVTLTPIDTILKTPQENVRIVKPVNEITPEPVVKKGKRTTLSVSVDNGILTANCRSEALENKIRLMQERIDRYREQLTRKEETFIAPERYVPWYIKILAWIGGITLVIFGIKLAIKFYKPI